MMTFCNQEEILRSITSTFMFGEVEIEKNLAL
jgi:hypothetical protein